MRPRPKYFPGSGPARRPDSALDPESRFGPSESACGRAQIRRISWLGRDGQLKPFNDDLFNQVIKECSSHHVGLQALFRNMQEEGLDIQTTRNADYYGALIHHLSLTRNKRCLMAYMYNRADVIRSLRWKLGRVLPNELVTKLSNSEKEYFKGYSAALDAYMNEMNLDLTVDMVPPKDPYIQVRVLDDIGEVLLTDRSANLARYSMHFLKRTDAEQYICQGLMEELLS
ncbi:hypothetical protein NL676_026795 [Syzygium grande]|nr:hypothetical protein NL676_026795 [Syzygium grande]